MFMLRVNALAGQPARDGLGPACAPYSGRGPLPMLSCTLNHVDILMASAAAVRHVRQAVGCGARPAIVACPWVTDKLF